MSKLRDNLYEIIRYETYINESICIDGIPDAAKDCEKIADEHAIGFRDFCNERANKSPLSNFGKTTAELLEIYKSEK